MSFYRKETAMRRATFTLVSIVFVLSLLMTDGAADVTKADSFTWPTITNSAADNHGKHTAPPPGKPDKRKWQGTTTKK